VTEEPKPTPPAQTPPPPGDTGSRADVEVFARRGLINFVGAVSYGLFTFLTVLLVTHALRTDEAGGFFEVVAMFTIASSVILFGAQNGLVRQISRARALNRALEIRRVVFAGTVPVFVAAVLASAAIALGASTFASTFADPNTATEVERMVVISTPFVLLSTVMYLALAVTRGLGTMVPTVAIDRMVRVSLQALGMAAVLVWGLSAPTAVLLWGLPFALAAVGATVWAVKLVRARESGNRGDWMPRSLGIVTGEFWRFAAPRGLASVFQTGSLWLDTLFLGALNSPGAAAIYTAGGRLTLVGSFFLESVVQALAPQVSSLMAKRELQRVQDVYRAATIWLVCATWPIYLLLAIFAPGVLTLFGKGYAAGAPAIVIMSGAMLISMAFGPVDIVLLMGGRSSLNLVNTVASLVTNVGLNLLLIPRWGISGAAFAWAASTVVNNVLPAAQVYRIFRVHTFGRQFWIPVASASAFVGGVAIAARAVAGPSILVMIVAGLVGGSLHAATLWRFRHDLRLAELRTAFGRRGRRKAEQPAP
jgi:O-antigen/teichoic acid export membrane protein